MCALIECRSRLTALIDVTYAMWTIFRYCIIPPMKSAAPTLKSPNERAKSPLMSLHSMGSTLSLGSSPIKLPEDKSQTKPHPITGYEGFQIEQFVSNIL